MSSDASTPENRRRAPRYGVKLQATVVAKEANSAAPFMFITENVSAGGMLIRGEREYYGFGEGTELEIWIYLDELLANIQGALDPNADDDRVYCRAAVMHVIAPKGFGLQITEMSDDDRNRYYNLIEKCAEDPSRIIP